MKTKKEVSIFIASAIIASILASITFTQIASAEEEPLYGGTLLTAMPNEPGHLFPPICTSAFVHTCADNIFDSLLSLDLESNIIPELAESWEVSSDGLTYTFHLVRNATWHDGVPFTSADVKFTIEEISLKLHPYGTLTFSNLEEVETPDDYTVILKLSKPWTVLLRMLAGNWYFTPAPKHIYEGTDILKNEYNVKPIGTGPFKFVEYKLGSHVTLERNPNYWKKDLPYLDKIVIRIIPDSMMRGLSLKTGDIDYLSKWIPFEMYEEIVSVPDLENSFRGTEALAMVNYLAFQMNASICPYTANKLVRQAICYAIDMDYLIEHIYGGYVEKSHSFLHKYLPYSDPLTYYDYDPDKAEQLLDDAGYPKGTDGIRFSLRLAYSPEQEFYIKTADVLQAQLGEVGIDVQFDVMDRATFHNKIYIEWDFDMHQGQWWTGPITAISYGRFVISDRHVKSTYTNSVAYNNSRVDWLFAQLGTESDETKLEEYYQELADILAEEIPYYHMVDNAEMCAWKDEFVGFPVGPWDGAQSLETIWWKGGSAVSAETAWDTIETVRADLFDFDARNYQVAEAFEELSRAEEAFDAGDYATAGTLANNALELVKAPSIPYELVAVAAIGWGMFAVVAVLYYKRRRG